MISASKSHAAAILVLWLGITALDFNKAFHIDDALHLQAAQWIARHPGNPMSGMVQWGPDPGPLHEFNQPPGFYYLIALTGELFGYSEGVMHAMRSLFSLLALACMYRLARHRAPSHALTLTALLALCPAFLVNQGLMTDVPLLAFILLFATLLLVPGKGGRALRLTLAALALSCALMIKYTALPLLVMFVIALVLRKEWKYLPLALIPLAVLAGWSLWNLHDYGGIHLLERGGTDRSLRGIYVRNLSLFTALGAVAPFTLAFLGAFGIKPKWIARTWPVLVAAALAFAACVYAGLVSGPRSDSLLRTVFTLNGVLLMVCCVRYLPRTSAPLDPETWTIAAWAFGLALFITVFAPMMATRHILLLLPPVLLLIAPALHTVRIAVKAWAVGTTAVLGLLLTLSDKAYAEFFRREAPIVAARLGYETTGTVWSMGYWGWQWYAQEAGMPPLGTRTSAVAVDDILVLPSDVEAQPWPEGLKVEAILRWDTSPTWTTFLNVEQRASLYSSEYEKLPWRLDPDHHQVITAYRVTAIH